MYVIQLGVYYTEEQSFFILIFFNTTLAQTVLKDGLSFRCVIHAIYCYNDIIHHSPGVLINISGLPGLWYTALTWLGGSHPLQAHSTSLAVQIVKHILFKHGRLNYMYLWNQGHKFLSYSTWHSRISRTEPIICVFLHKAS